MAALIPAIASAATAPAIVIESKQPQKQNKNQKRKKTNKKKSKSSNNNPNSRRSRRAFMTASGPSAVGFGSQRVSPKELAMFRKMCREAIGVLQSGVSTSNSSLPVRRSVRMGGQKISFDFAHLAQRNVDRTFKNGVRICISCTDGASPNGYGQLLIRGGNSGQGIEPFACDTKYTNDVYVRMAPSVLSDLTKVLAEVFEYYALRYSRFRYVPVSGSYSSTTINTNVALALGVLTDPDGTGYGGGTFKTITDLETHVTTHVTEPCELEYVFTGIETFSINTNDAADERFQATLVGAFDTAPTVGGNTTSAGSTYGHIEAFHIMDFYGIRSVHTTVPAQLDEKTETKLLPVSRVQPDYIVIPPQTPDAKVRSQSVPRK